MRTEDNNKLCEDLMRKHPDEIALWEAARRYANDHGLALAPRKRRMYADVRGMVITLPPIAEKPSLGFAAQLIEGTSIWQYAASAAERDMIERIAAAMGARKWGVWSIYPSGFRRWLCDRRLKRVLLAWATIERDAAELYEKARQPKIEEKLTSLVVQRIAEPETETAPPPQPEPVPPPALEPKLDLRSQTFIKMLLYQYKSYYETGHTPSDVEAAKKFREERIWKTDESSQARAYNRWLNSNLPKELRPPRDTARGGDRWHG